MQDIIKEAYEEILTQEGFFQKAAATGAFLGAALSADGAPLKKIEPLKSTPKPVAAAKPAAKPVNTKPKTEADKKQQIINNVVAILRTAEGYSATPYQLKGEEYKTIGYGFYLDNDKLRNKMLELRGLNRAKLLSGEQQMSKAQAEDLLVAMTEMKYIQLLKMVPEVKNYSAKTIEALLEMSYQLGSLSEFPKMCEAIRNHEYDDIIEEFKDSTYYRTPAIHKRVTRIMNTLQAGLNETQSKKIAKA